jgi:hypothetical protein
MASPQQVAEWAADYLFQAARRASSSCFDQGLGADCLLQHRDRVESEVAGASQTVTAEVSRLFSLPREKTAADVRELEAAVVETFLMRCGQDPICLQNSPAVRRAKDRIEAVAAPWARAANQRFTAWVFFIFLVALALLLILAMVLLRYTRPTFPPMRLPDPNGADMFIATPAAPL